MNVYFYFFAYKHLYLSMRHVFVYYLQLQNKFLKVYKVHLILHCQVDQHAMGFFPNSLEWLMSAFFLSV